MKKRIIIISVVFLTVGTIGFTNKGETIKANIKELSAISLTDSLSVNQDLRYEIRAKYKRPVQQEILKKAQLISDVISGYPKNWITSYTSVEILATCGGKTLMAKSKNDTLSQEQKNILNTIDLNTDIIIHIKYTYNNPSTKTIENNETNVAMTMIPHIEAEHIADLEGENGYIKHYLKENNISIPNDIEQCIVDFMINEEGEISNIRVARTSGKLEVDKLLMELISKMPKWKPAEDSKGIKVQQEFQLTIGKVGVGC